MPSRRKYGRFDRLGNNHAAHGTRRVESSRPDHLIRAGGLRWPVERGPDVRSRIGGWARQPVVGELHQPDPRSVVGHGPPFTDGPLRAREGQGARRDPPLHHVVGKAPGPHRGIPI